MTYPLRDIVDNIYHVVSKLGLSPSEAEDLTTYEFNEYVRLLNKDEERRAEEQRAMFKSLGPLASLFSLGGKR